MSSAQRNNEHEPGRDRATKQVRVTSAFYGSIIVSILVAQVP